MKRIVILVSGQGSNMQRIAEACRAEGWPAAVVAVIANKPGAPALEAARALGLTAETVDHQGFGSREAFDLELQRRIDAHRPDLVVLAGFMRILGEDFVRHYEGRMLNIHPSLLPAFAGLHTHRRALESGCKLAGATVHLVTPQLDHGPIVMQAAVPVRADDDEHRLAERVLAAEHVIYPRSIRWWVEGRLAIEAGSVRQTEGAPQWLWHEG